MKKYIISLTLCIMLFLTCTIQSQAATVVNSMNGSYLKLYNGSSIGTDITNQSVYHVGDWIYPKLYSKSGTCWRSGAWKMGDSGTIINGSKIKSNCFVLTKPGTYTIVGSYYSRGAGSVYCELKVVVVE